MFKQSMLLISLLFLSNVLFSVLVSGTSSCSIDLSYVNTYPWDTSNCHPSDGKQCCQTLLSLFGMGLAQHLKDTGIFQLPDFESSSSCLSELQDRLASLSIQPSVVPLCFQNSTQFVVNASSCAGIVTTKDWINRVGPRSVLDTNCKGGRTGLTWCSSCLEAGMTVNSQLKALSPNSTECFYFTVLYAAAIANEFGPKDARTASCILGLPLYNSASTSKMSRKTVLKWVIGLFGALIGVLLALVLIILHRKRDKKMDVWHTDTENSSKGSNVLPKTGAKWFRLCELERATNGFSQKNLVGQGAYGVVYKGILSDGTLIAVKEMLDLDSKGDEDFSNEVEIISKIKHRNLLSLHGCCVTGDNVKRKRRFLVYDFMSNGSISDQLFGYGAHGTLTWPQRKNIILDIAKGLEYLHHGIKPPVYHRDIKGTNILLDSEMRAKVADFGLAKQGNEGQSHLTTRVAGTYGYLAPEYALYGQLTEKSDVYSFGIVILQIMSGRKVLDTANSSMVLITDWAWMLAKSGKVEAIFDQAIKEGPTTVMERFVLVGILCAHVMVALRPTIADAIKMLEGDIDIQDLHDRPLPLGHESFRSSLSPIHRVEEKKSSNGSRAYLRV